jgi:hypothetical protein
MKDGEEGWTKIKIETEHRAAKHRRPFDLSWTMDEDDGLGMAWAVDLPQSLSDKKTSNRDRILEAVRSHGRRGILVNDLCDEVDLGPPAVKRYLNEMDSVRVRRNRKVARQPLTAWYVGNHHDPEA